MAPNAIAVFLSRAGNGRFLETPFHRGETIDHPDLLVRPVWTSVDEAVREHRATLAEWESQSGPPLVVRTLDEYRAVETELRDRTGGMRIAAYVESVVEPSIRRLGDLRGDRDGRVPCRRPAPGPVSRAGDAPLLLPVDPDAARAGVAEALAPGRDRLARVRDRDLAVVAVDLEEAGRRLVGRAPARRRSSPARSTSRRRRWSVDTRCSRRRRCRRRRSRSRTPGRHRCRATRLPAPSRSRRPSTGRPRRST